MKTNLDQQNDASNLDLTARVRSFLSERHFPALRQVEVEVRGETVILKGRVSTFHERQLAIAFCQRVAGVYDVVDCLTVAVPVLLADESGARRVRA
jgi:osmotically-inducible protein OsmY